MSSTRLHVKNLPVGTDESSMANFFKSFGEITDVNIKNDYGFFSVSAPEEKITQAISKISGKKWNNCDIVVTKAKKENFMARLAKEREAAVVEAEEKPQTLSDDGRKHASSSKKRKRHSQQSGENSDDDSQRSGVPMFLGTRVANLNTDKDETMQKLADFDSMWADEDHNESSINFSNYLKKGKTSSKKIKKNEKEIGIKAELQVQSAPVTKQEKKLKDDERRRKTLAEKEKEKMRQKSMIASALANNSVTKTNKIVFDDDDVSAKPPEQEKLQLFDDENEEEYTIPEKNYFAGKTGEELFKLQSTFNNDSRFQLDERFLGGKEEDMESNQIKRRQAEMVRFDPTTARSPEKSKDKPSKTAAPIVSNEKFYEVAENIKSTLKEKSEGFSLLATYGTNRETKTTKEPSPAPDNPQRPAAKSYPIIKDSSDEEAEAEEQDCGVDAWKTPIAVSSSNKFFFSANDPLFAEAMEFINKKNSAESAAYAENFETTRRALKKVFKDQATRRLKKTSMFRRKVGEKAKLPTSKFTKARPNMQKKFKSH